jgi:hypothetical protein
MMSFQDVAAEPEREAIERPAWTFGNLYGFGAVGERDSDRVLNWFHADPVRTMSLVGAGAIADLDRSLLDLPNRPTGAMP